jgi:hypothetical protein
LVSVEMFIKTLEDRMGVCGLSVGRSVGQCTFKGNS